MGNGDVRKIMSEDAIAALKLNPKDEVVGACPDGWRLPNSDELNALSRMANAAEHGFEDLDDAEDVTVNFNVRSPRNTSPLVASSVAVFSAHFPCLAMSARNTTSKASTLAR